MTYLLLLDWFQDLDDALLLRLCVDALKHFTVLASADFSDDLVIILAPAQGQG